MADNNDMEMEMSVDDVMEEADKGNEPLIDFNSDDDIDSNEDNDSDYWDSSS